MALAPSSGEIKEAKKFPDGYIYRIDPHCHPNGNIPPDKIVGAWKVDEHGEIVGNFIPNEKYQP